MNPKEFADKYLEPYIVRGDEIIPRYCPYCNGGEHNDKQTFALNQSERTYNCKRGSCGKRGTFFQLCEDFNEESDEKKDWKENNRREKKKFEKPKIKVTDLASDKVKNYLETRGFSEKTWRDMGVFEHNGNIAFPYYEDGELVLVKYRKPQKHKSGTKAWREEGGKAVFWGMDKCDTNKPLIITEGEYDTLALKETGFNNVVSVPSGAEDLTCIEHCWEWIEKFKKIIIWGDNDDAGQKMVNEIVARLGEWKCYIVQSKYKDANLHLYQEGKKAVVQAIEKAEAVPLKGVVRLAEVEEFDLSETEKVSSGFKELDRATAGFIMGEISVWTGENGSGKSTLIGQTLVEAIDNGYKVCAFSGELKKSVFRYWIELQGASHRYILVDDAGDTERYWLTKEIKQAMRQWYFDKFFLFDSDKTRVDADDVLNVFRNVARRYGVKVFLIDNLIKMNLADKNSDLIRGQSEFIDKCSVFAHKYNCHLHIVAHPRKTKDEITKMDISGSGDITNLADNVYKIKRVSDKEKRAKRLDSDALLMILKNRLLGSQGQFIKLNFNKRSKRFSETNNPIQNDKKFGWERIYNENEETE